MLRRRAVLILSIFGHVHYLVASKMLGDTLLVIVNNDNFLKRKKGYVFMPLAERMRIVKALRCVDIVIPCIDKDDSVCETLRKVTPDIFANGGDRKVGGILEEQVCEELGIRIVDGLGAKVQSSSKLVAKVRLRLT